MYRVNNHLHYILRKTASGFTCSDGPVVTYSLPVLVRTCKALLVRTSTSTSTRLYRQEGEKKDPKNAAVKRLLFYLKEKQQQTKQPFHNNHVVVSLYLERDE